MNRFNDIIRCALECVPHARGDEPHYERYKDEYTSRLNRSARSYERVIQEHLSWIENPYLKLPADADEETIKRYVEQKWPDDIARNQAYKDIIIGILMERKNAKR